MYMRRRAPVGPQNSRRTMYTAKASCKKTSKYIPFSMYTTNNEGLHSVVFGY